MAIDWEKMVSVFPQIEEMMRASLERDITEFYRGNGDLTRNESISNQMIFKRQLVSAYKMNPQELRLVELFMDSYGRGVAQGAVSLQRVISSHLQTIKGH